MLHFHSKTFEILKEPPRLRLDCAEVLSAIEKRLRRPLSVSLKEWYSLESACRFVGDHVPLNQLGANLELDGTSHDLVRRDLLPVIVHSEGFGVWAVLLDGSDDPPVMVDVDSAFKKWVRYADRFSEFVLARVWDHALLHELMAKAESRSDSEVVRVLQTKFRPHVTTHGWPSDIQHRFEHEGSRIRIDASDRSAEWWIASPSEASFRRVLQNLAGFNDLTKALDGQNPAAERILEG